MIENLQLASALLGRQIGALAVALELVRWSVRANTTEQAFLEEAVRNVANALRVPLCKVLEPVDQGQWFRIRADVGLDATLSNSARITTETTSHAGLALRLGSPVICGDLPSVTHFSGAGLLRRQGAVSGIATPIGGAGGPLGVLTVHAKFHREFSEEEVRFLNMVAAALAEGIQLRRSASADRAASNTQSRQHT